MDKKLKIPLILKGELFDIESSKFYLNEDNVLSEIRKQLNERKYTVNETKLPYRVMSHWDKLGLLPDGVNSEKGWRKFNFVELIWLKVAERLRGFGLSLEKIGKIKSDVMEYHKKLGVYYPFEYYVFLTLATKQNPFVLVLSNGEADIGTSAEIQSSNLIFGSRDTILISLKSITQEIGLKNIPKEETLFSLTELEADVLKGIRIEDNDEVKISIKERRIKEIEKTIKVLNPDKAYEAGRNIKDSDGFGEISTKFEMVNRYTRL